MFQISVALGYLVQLQLGKNNDTASPDDSRMAADNCSMIGISSLFSAGVKLGGPVPVYGKIEFVAVFSLDNGFSSKPHFISKEIIANSMTFEVPLRADELFCSSVQILGSSKIPGSSAWSSEGHCLFEKRSFTWPTGRILDLSIKAE